jgi:hypothetical protein
MRFHCLPILLFATVALAQTNMTGPPNQTATAPDTASEAFKAAELAARVSSDAAVITVIGLCDNQPAAKNNVTADRATAAGICKTVVTRKEFDAIAEAIQPDISPAGKAQLAAFYPKLLIMQREFRERNLENDPKVQKGLAFSKLRSEAEETAKVLKERASDVPDSEIQKYYEANASNYEQAELLRMFVPEDPKYGSTLRDTPGPSKMANAMKNADGPMKKTAEALRVRAAAGEDFAKLQQEGFNIAGMPGTPPEINIGMHMANEMSADRKPLISMKVGEVSEVLGGPNGYYIYKVASKSVRPLEKVRAEIIPIVAEQKFSEQMAKIDQSARTVLNSTYFPTASSGNGSTSLSGTNFGSTGLGDRRLAELGLGKAPSPRGLGSRGARVGSRSPMGSPRLTLPAPQATQPASEGSARTALRN